MHSMPLIEAPQVVSGLDRAARAVLPVGLLMEAGMPAREVHGSIAMAFACSPSKGPRQRAASARSAPGPQDVNRPRFFLCNETNQHEPAPPRRGRPRTPPQLQAAIPPTRTSTAPLWQPRRMEAIE